MENFIKLQINKDYTLYQNVIISYLQSFQENNKYYYAGVKELSSILNIPISSLNNSINDLIKKKVIFKSKDKKYIQHTFNNRSAIVLVDKNNHYPTNDTSNIKPNEVKTKNDTNIPQEEIKVVTDEKTQLQKLLEDEIEKLDKERNTSPDYITTLIGDKGLIVIDEDLRPFFNEEQKYEEDWVKKYMLSKSEWKANDNLRNKMISKMNKEKDIEIINNKN